GVAMVAALVLAAYALGWVLSLGGPVVQVVVAAILLAQKSLVQHVAAVADALRLSTGDGRRMVARIVSRETGAMQESDIARAAIESASENLSDGVIAPAFWFLVGGLPGILVYKIVNTADSMVGYRTERHEAFGWAAARLDDGLNLIPARLTALMIWAVGGARGDWRAIVADANRHRSPNAGWPEAAMSRALGVALAGPRVYDGHLRDLAWVNGDARRDAGADDIDAAVRLLWRTWVLALALCLPIAIL
ncbi:MAG: cobalamin biosynthesis protein CobD, partial [Rhodobacteraceae bacterium]